MAISHIDTSARSDHGAATRPKRADALHNVEAILDAATRRLAVDPDASVNEIAEEAGVGRITLYGHFDLRSLRLAGDPAPRGFRAGDRIHRRRRVTRPMRSVGCWRPPGT
ncbi:TetR family transcriptional regulator [Gordonia sp. ABSL11-1]|uniref:TetR family transcriptional regulator n=1 Tax=Gordonia sp. ABSL11-1 TaxID=3053924 RepID=UPI003365572F